MRYSSPVLPEWEVLYILVSRARNGPTDWPSCDYTFARLSALYRHAEDVLLCSSLLSGNGCLAKPARSLLEVYISYAFLFSNYHLLSAHWLIHMGPNSLCKAQLILVSIRHVG